ncbi:MAG: hypothetical protein KDD47_27095, partial [Acidobacteria bacterium]|nr:hypothetical protein [Acidobacteriota bacterium]
MPVALLAILGLVTAPILGPLRDWLLATFSRSFVLVLATAMGAAFAAILGLGIWRIRVRRRLRYA